MTQNRESNAYNGAPGKHNNQSMSKRKTRETGSRDGRGYRLASSKIHVRPESTIPVREHDHAKHDQYCREKLAPSARGIPGRLMLVFLWNERCPTPIMWTRVKSALGRHIRAVHKIIKKGRVYHIIITSQDKDDVIGDLISHSAMNNYKWEVRERDKDDSESPAESPHLGQPGL